MTKLRTTLLVRTRLLALALSALCGAALPFSAGAVNLNSQGSGQALIFPYYTTRDGNATLISLFNHTDQVKALKVQVREADAGRSILAFNLYLAPRDVWTATLLNRNGEPVLNTADSSCTVPQIQEVDLDLSALDTAPDSGRNSRDRAAEGYLEVIEMGTVDAAGLGANALFTDSNSASPEPESCITLIQAWQSGPNNGVWTVNPQVDLAAPGGGISGQGVIINVTGARAAQYRAVALDHFYQPQNPGDAISLHSRPRAITPDLSAAFPAISLIEIPTGLGPAQISDAWPTGAQAVSAVLMYDLVQNTFGVERVLNGRTDWVLTFPTKYLHTLAGEAQSPFTATFVETSVGANNGQACEGAELFNYDLNGFPEDLEGTGVIHDPPPPPPPYESLCYAVNTVAYYNSVPADDAATNEANNSLSDLLGGRTFINLDAFFPFIDPVESGKTDLTFNAPADIVNDEISHQLVNPISGNIYNGLPVIGFSVRGAENQSIGALFGVSNPHLFTRRIEVVNP